MSNATVTPITRPGESRTLTRASAQWRDRPDDERFPTIEALRDKAWDYRRSCVEEVTKLSSKAIEVDGDEILVGKQPMNNWAFSQLCSTLGTHAGPTPANVLRTLPSDLSTQIVQHRMKSLDPMHSVKLLTSRGRINALTGPNYGRVWNAEIADWLVGLQQAQPWWTFPVAFKKANGEQVQGAWGESKELPVAFLSDRDMFVFLADYEHAIEIPGVEHPLLRGFWIENSETGASAIRITLFLFDFVCCNVLVWGARNVIEVKIRHTSSARDRMLVDDSEARLAIEEYANRSTAGDIDRIVKARSLLVADTRQDVIETLFAHRLPGVTKAIVEQAVAAVERTPRYGDPKSVWGLVNGLTEVSQRLPYAGDRTEVDRSAGKLIDLYVPST